MTNILVFPCGSEIGLEIHGALQHAKGIRLVGASSVPDHGQFVYRNYAQIDAFVGADDFLDELRRVITAWEIDLVYPAIDVLIEALAGLEPDDLAGARVIGSGRDTNLITRYKSLTYQALAGFDFVPQVYALDTVTPDDFAVFLKPDGGFGSNGISVATDAEDLARQMSERPDLIAVELLPGREYTVDCFTDRHRQLLFIGPRSRERIKSGIAVRSECVPLSPEIEQIAHAINSRIEFRGQWFFQVKEDAGGELKLLEIGPRVAGTMNLHRVRGVNLPLLTVLDRLGQDVEVLDNRFGATVDRALVNRHRLDIKYEAIYVDLDDTLIVSGEVNTQLMVLLYQAKRDAKPVVLITRHASDVEETLDRYAISPTLFARIVHITDGSPKSAHIGDGPVVFIDDSFRERADVLQNCDAIVFDVDGVEALIDWRA